MSTPKKGPQPRKNFQQKKNNSTPIQNPKLLELLNNEISRTYVVNVRKEKPDVYVGRRNPLYPPSECCNYKYGNPFKMEGEETREQCLLDFWEYLEGNPELINDAKQELRGKKLGCWCAPLLCHAMVLAKFANE